MSKSSTLADTLRDFAITLVPILLAWGISAEVRIQTGSSKLDTVAEQAKQTAGKLERDHDIIVQNAVSVAASDKAIKSLEVQTRELIKLLNR